MESKWFAIMVSVLAIGFFTAIAIQSNNQSQERIQQEVTKQLQIQLDLEKAKNK
jgi:sensor domain CHASE-containing protein